MFLVHQTVQLISCLWLSTDVYTRPLQQQLYRNVAAAQYKAHVAAHATVFDSRRNNMKALAAAVLTCVSSTAQAKGATQLAPSERTDNRVLTVPPSFLTNASISCLLCWP